MRGWFAFGRDLGVQRHPDGCVVHAFRCASRSGAGPHRENWPEVGVPVSARHPFPVGYVRRPPSYGNWATRGFAALRAAVPAPTGRTGQRSAVPCQRVIPSRWGTCRDGRHTGTGRHAVSLRFAQRCRAPPGGLPRGRRSRASGSSFPGGVLAETGVIRELGDTRFRCAARSGAGPHRENWPEVGGPLPARHRFPVGYVPRRASYGNWAIRGFATPRLSTGELSGWA